MKKVLLASVLASIVIAQSLIAQPVLDYCSHPPQPGQVLKARYMLCDTTNANEGPAGPNRYWDFSNWAVEWEGSGFDTFVDPQTTYFAADFPTANVCFGRADSAFIYWEVTDSQFSYHGEGDLVFALPMVSTDPEIEWVCPFSYGEQFYDVIKYQLGPFQKWKGSKTVTYDAYGLLKLPNLGFYNVVRTHTLKSITKDNVEMKYDIYNWFETTHFRPICTLNRMHSSLGGAWAKVASVTIYTPMAPVGLPESSADLVKIAPNPARDRVQLRAAASLVSGQWLLYDIYGREVLRHRVSAMESDVDLSNLSTGIYMGRLITPKGVALETGKIVKQ